MTTSEGTTRVPAGESGLDPRIAARLKRDRDGLIAAIVQQHDTGEVLMLGWMDDEALHRTLTTGRGTFWSRSRQEYWVKGETSGHAQWVKSVALDCDADAVLAASVFHFGEIKIGEVKQSLCAAGHPVR